MNALDFLDADPGSKAAPQGRGIPFAPPQPTAMDFLDEEPDTSAQHRTGSVLDPLIEMGHRRFEALNKTHKAGGVLRNLGAGAAEFATGLGSFLSDPGPDEELNALGITPDIPAETPQIRQHRLNEVLGPANPENVEADTADERIARGVGGGLASAVIPGGGVGLGARALIGAASGLGGSAAAEVAPDAWKPAASVVGGLVGGVGGALASTIPKAAVLAGKSAGRVLIDPFTKGGRDRIVGERLTNAATDPEAVRRSLESVDELVPGSQPTTFQATGDIGLGGLERQVQTKNPEAFATRRGEQNTARRGQLDRLQPGGSAADLAGYVKGRMRWLDQQTEQDVADATRVAQERAQGLGGDRLPEEHGSALRQAAQDAEDTARTRERALWRAVDPNGDLTVGSSGVRLEARSIMAGISGSAKPLSGDETTILRAASDYGHTVPFRELGDLRSYTSDAMRQELRTNGQTQTYARLSRMRSAIERSINSTIERRATEAPEELRAGLGTLEQQATQWAGDGAARSEGVGAYDATGTGGVSSVSRARGAVDGRPGTPTGDQGLPGQPTFDEAAAGRLRQANTATRERADTFGRGPVGDVLKKAGRQDQYRLGDASVGLKIFTPGPKGGETVASYRNAVGDGEAMTVLQDYAASALRRSASRPDGTLDPAKVTAWMDKHTDAMRAFPDLQARFRNASSASEALAESAANRRTILDEAHSGALGKVSGLQSAEDVTATVGGIFGSKNSVQQMRELARTASRNPDAREGLRKSVADYIGQKFISNTEAATSGETQIKSDQFQTFVRKSRTTLGEVFSPEEVQSLQAIADDLQRSNRSVTAVKIPGQSNTAQDVLAKEKGGPSVLGRILTQAGSFVVGAAASGTFGGGIAGWMGAKAIATLKDFGIQSTDDVLKDAMLNPAFARTLLAKVPTKTGPTFQNILARRLRRALATGPLATNDKSGEQPR